jgi:hypothetical protein
MKQVLVLCIVLLTVNSLKAQMRSHRHDGFYFSINMGPVFGSVTNNFGPYKEDMIGTGGQLDIKIGASISRNLIAHATLISNTMEHPTVKLSNSTESQVYNNLVVGEAVVGVGLTYYVMPYNIFFSGSGGLGNFSTMHNDNKALNAISNKGFSWQLKMGKEWWISKNWGLGFGFTFGKTTTKNIPYNSAIEKLDSNRFAVLFNATFD